MEQFLNSQKCGGIIICILQKQNVLEREADRILNAVLRKKAPVTLKDTQMGTFQVQGRHCAELDLDDAQYCN